jgi:DNA-damage-inducible protein D
MYNMSITRLQEMRGIGNRSPLDFMGSTELAANLFRLTQTDERIRKKGVHGQQACAQEAHVVGREVRATMEKLSNTFPEKLPPTEDIKQAK